MQERLDQTCRLPLGTRDAIHVPFVVARHKARTAEERLSKLYVTPGDYVKFTDDTYTQFFSCPKEEAQGIVNPFLDEINLWEEVIVFIMPGITTTVRHTFDIDRGKRAVEQTLLQAELKAEKENDPECAGCWMIRNNEVMRS